MDYKQNLIEAYAKLDKAVEMHLAEGGGVDDRPQLKAELAWRLRQLEKPTVKDRNRNGVKLWPNGHWYADGFQEMADEKGYLHIVRDSAEIAWYNKLHVWLAEEFLKEELATLKLCGKVRNTIHHINGDKKDNNAFGNLVYVPKDLHQIFHCDQVNVPEFARRVCEACEADKALTVKKPSDKQLDARVLWKGLGLKRKFGTWVKQWADKVNFIPMIDKSLGKTPQDVAVTLKSPAPFALNGTFTETLQDIAVHANGQFTEQLKYTVSLRDALKITMGTNTEAAKKAEDLILAKLESAQTLADAITNAPRSNIEAALATQNIALLRQIEAYQTQLSTWQDLVGDGGYVSKRAVRRLKKELPNA